MTNLQPHKSPGSAVTQENSTWHLEIPGGNGDSYRLAQLDDYKQLPRLKFPHADSTALRLVCRVSEPNLPGTWGFGFWNDPFAVSLGLGGGSRRLPVLPNACWFFHASAENHLSFREVRRTKPNGISTSDESPRLTENLPAGGCNAPSPLASGFLAQSFSSPRIPSALLAPGAVFAPLLLISGSLPGRWRKLSAWLRAGFGKIISEDAKSLDVDVTQWHEYQIQGGPNRVDFLIDGEKVFDTGIRPKGPLGLVIWIDNQFAAWRPDGTLKAGVLPHPRPAWMEFKELDAR